MTAYAAGRWRVAAGREDEFVRTWEELAIWSEANLEDSGGARLLQSRDDPSVFLGVFDFPGVEAIAEWREHPEVARRLDALAGLAESAEPGVFELRAEVG